MGIAGKRTLQPDWPVHKLVRGIPSEIPNLDLRFNIPNTLTQFYPVREYLKPSDGEGEKNTLGFPF